MRSMVDGSKRDSRVLFVEKNHKRFLLLVQGWVKTREECESAEKVLDESSSLEGESVYVEEEECGMGHGELMSVSDRGEKGRVIDIIIILTGMRCEIRRNIAGKNLPVFSLLWPLLFSPLIPLCHPLIISIAISLSRGVGLCCVMGRYSVLSMREKVCRYSSVSEENERVGTESSFLERKRERDFQFIFLTMHVSIKLVPISHVSTVQVINNRMEPI